MLHTEIFLMTKKFLHVSMKEKKKITQRSWKSHLFWSASTSYPSTCVSPLVKFSSKSPPDSLQSTLGDQQTHFKPLWRHSEHLKSQRKLRAYSLAGWMAVRHRASRTYAFETKAECAKSYCMSWESRGAFPASAARPQLLATSALTGLPLQGWSKTSNWSLWHWSVETTELLRTQCLD